MPLACPLTCHVFWPDGRYYYSHNTGLQAQNVIYSQSSLDSEPVKLLDPNTLSKDGTVCICGTLIPCQWQKPTLGRQHPAARCWGCSAVQPGQSALLRIKNARPQRLVVTCTQG